MKYLSLLFTAGALMLSSCVSIPQETVQLSETIGQDIEILHQSHKRAITLYYTDMKRNVNAFVDDVFKPYLIEYMTNSEMARHEAGEVSMFGYLANISEGHNRDSLLSNMNAFNAALDDEVSTMRKDLMGPIEKQEATVLASLDAAYGNVLHGNSVLTGYLRSARKAKEAQQEALRVAGLEGFDEQVTQNIIEASNKVEKMVEYGKKVDLKVGDIEAKVDSMHQIINSITK